MAGGTGIKAQIPGYAVAGKTGTAEKPLPDGSGYSKTDYVASFIGMVPADHPGSWSSCAVEGRASPSSAATSRLRRSQQIMQFALQHLEIAP